MLPRNHVQVREGCEYTQLNGMARNVEKEYIGKRLIVSIISPFEACPFRAFVPLGQQC